MGCPNPSTPSSLFHFRLICNLPWWHNRVNIAHIHTHKQWCAHSLLSSLMQHMRLMITHIHTICFERRESLRARVPSQLFTQTFAQLSIWFEFSRREPSMNNLMYLVYGIWVFVIRMTLTRIALQTIINYCEHCNTSSAFFPHTPPPYIIFIYHGESIDLYILVQHTVRIMCYCSPSIIVCYEKIGIPRTRKSKVPTTGCFPILRYF